MRLQDDLVGQHERQARRGQVLTLLRAATAAVDPYAAVRRTVRREGTALRVGDQSFDLSSFRHVFVVGAGKATAAMASALEQILDDRLTEGIIVVKDDVAMSTGRIRQLQAGHPVPDAAGVAATRAILDLVARATTDDLVLCLISGGGSSLLVAPAPPTTLADKQALTSVMLRSGCTIHEMNTVRKHCSEVKGGQLARLAAPATVVTLLVSDVLGNRLDVIASGPTVPDPTSYRDALRVLANHEILYHVPAAIRQRLEEGDRGRLPETPKPSDAIFTRTTNLIVSGIDIACDAALHAAREMGFATLLLSTYVEGEAREIGKVFAAI